MPGNVNTIKPYRWGKFQGWFLILAPPLFALWCFAVASAGIENDYGYALVAAITSALTIPMGIGILKKRRYGLILVYLALGLACFSILVAFVRNGTNGAFSAATGAIFWAVSTVYYRNRRDEFV
jgi:hypothetical protein